MKFDLVIFDLDGVLVDSTEAITNTFNQVLIKAAGISVSDKNIIKMIGMPLDQMFERYLPNSMKGEARNCSRMYRQIYGKTCVQGTKVYDGVIDVLEYLKSSKLAVATTKYSNEAEILLKGMAIRKYFKFVLGADDVRKPKPNPEVIDKILDLAGVSRSKAAIVGDTAYDILAGKSAGITTIAATYGFQNKDVLAAAKPDFLIDSLPDLKSIVR
ncbi:MAG: HAD-IA family hydrolase [Candidatus Aenigmarchaeota archaeon]|nr:HAD-IA family hydrolase [Candidatus Aenigmarchaeota archaeon]